MNIIVGIVAIFTMLLASIVLYLLEHHNARAVLFVTIFTMGIIGLVLSVAFGASFKPGSLHVTPIEFLELKQYTAWQAPEYRLLLAALGAILSIVLLAIMLEVVVVFTNERPIKNLLMPTPKKYPISSLS